MGIAQVIGSKGRLNGAMPMQTADNMQSVDEHNQAAWENDYNQQLDTRAKAQKRYLELKQGQLLSQLDPSAPDYNQNVMKIYTQFNGPEAGRMLAESALRAKQTPPQTPEEKFAEWQREWDYMGHHPHAEDLATQLLKAGAMGNLKTQQDAANEAAKQKAAADKASEDVARVVSPYLAVAEHVTPSGGIVGTANSIMSGAKSLVGMESPEKALQTLSVSLAPAIQQKMMATSGRYNESLANAAKALLPSGNDSPGLRQIKVQFLQSLGDKNKSVEDAVNETTALVSKLYSGGGAVVAPTSGNTVDFPSRDAAKAALSTLPAGTTITINGVVSGTVK